MPTARKPRLGFLAVGCASEFRHLLFKLFGRDSKLAVEHLNPEAKRDIRSCGVAVADHDGWQADGMDLQHIRVIAVDSKGRRVSNAVGDVTVKVEGNATLAAMSNGNINTDELSVTDRQKLFNGSCLAILRAGTTPSPVFVTVSAPGLKSTKLKLATK